MTRHTRWKTRLALICSTVGLLCTAQAQEEFVVELSDSEDVPAELLQLMEAQQPAETAAAANPEEKALQELLKLKFDRSSAQILEAQNTLATGGAPADKPNELFRLHVVAGRWKEAGDFLQSLPEPHRAPLYEHVLRDLSRVPTSPAQMQGQQGPPPLPTLLDDDLLALADMAPAELTPAQLKLLGALLQRMTMTSKGYIDPLLKRLDEGTARLGGPEQAKRELAAELLLNANLELEAAKFLPPLVAGQETASLTLLDKHVRCIFSEAKAETNKQLVERAWQLNQMLLSAANCPPELRKAAQQRSIEIIPFLPNERAAAWLKEAFLKEPQAGLTILTAVGTQVAKDRSQRDIAKRKKNIELQRRVAEALLAAPAHRTQWQPALDLFALNWIEEADYAKNRYQPPRPQGMQYDQFGNQVYYGNNMPVNQNPNQLQPIAIPDVLSAAPEKEWLAATDPGLQPRLLALTAELHLKLENDTEAVPHIEQLAALQPKEALRLANETLRVWGVSRDPQRAMPQRRNVVYYGPYGMQQQGGIPLTRAVQQRNLEELSALLTRLREMPIPPLEDSAIVSAFAAAHSQAEVFRAESIELVLGKADQIKPETLAEILQTMRQRLATQWRQPRVQQQAKTQRTDAQIDAEVLRGYELLAGLIAQGIARTPDDWRLNLVQAAAWYDWAEFQYGKKVDLAIYVEKRDHAFAAFQRAAELYAAKLPSLEEKDQTPLVYQLWLNANLGASDLAYVTRQQEPSAGNLELIRKAILALPDGAAERHFTELAKAITGSADSLPAHLKAGYMRAALGIIGERKDAEEIRKLVSYYNGLLREIEVSVRVDGDTTVGHTEPFGVFLSVRHTAELERENSGGFSKYLRNQSQNQYYYNPYGTPPVDHRDELEKQMREKLSEGFEVLSITFHDEKVQSRGYGRDGWRETPLVYLLLKAKDASVDRIPSLRLDMDFADRHGPVVLPVESSAQLIDARVAAAPARPVQELDVTSTLDDRAAAEGKLTLEVKVTAKGLVPKFEELFDFAPQGYTIAENTDSGPAIHRLDSEGDELAAVSERDWLIQLIADRSDKRAAAFAFPKPKTAEMKVAYKRYEDADLVEVQPELALAGIPLRERPWWPWALSGATLAVLGFVALRLRRRPATAEERASYEMPEAVTPFTALDLLRKMHADGQLTLSSEHRAELGSTMSEIEGYYFAPHRNGASAPDLESISRSWIERARGIR